MSAPDSTMIVTNTSMTQSIWAGGQQIAPQGSFTFDKTAMPIAVSDINFMCAFVNGGISVNINGFGVPSATPAMVAFLIAIAIGDIVP